MKPFFILYKHLTDKKLSIINILLLTFIQNQDIL